MTWADSFKFGNENEQAQDTVLSRDYDVTSVRLAALKPKK